MVTLWRRVRDCRIYFTIRPPFPKLNMARISTTVFPPQRDLHNNVIQFNRLCDISSSSISALLVCCWSKPDASERAGRSGQLCILWLVGLEISITDPVQYGHRLFGGPTIGSSGQCPKTEAAVVDKPPYKPRLSWLLQVLQLSSSTTSSPLLPSWVVKYPAVHWTSFCRSA